MDISDDSHRIEIEDVKQSDEMIGTIDEVRLITENGVANKVGRIISPLLRSVDFRLVRVKIYGVNGCTVQIMAERADGTISINDCEEISQLISPVLDVEEPISAAYTLEVSSPGMDRPLVRVSDFLRWVGHEIRIEMANPLDGRKRFRGVIKDIDGEFLILSLPKEENGNEEIDVKLEIRDMAEARLLLNDELIAEALRRAKKEARAQIDDEDGAEALNNEDVNKKKDISKIGNKRELTNRKKKI